MLHILAAATLALLLAHDATPPPPQLLAPGVLSTGDDEWGFTMSPAGDAVWFNKADRGYRYQVIMEATRGADGQWQAPRVAAFSGQYRDIDPALSPDGRYLVFASNRPLQAGGARRADFDLWRVDRLPDGSWSAPRHLGEKVNSAGAETNSSIAADGTLYFSVSGRPGVLGQRDLMRARLTTEGYADPEPLPAPINSEADESNHWIAPDQSYLLFLSNRAGGIGENDLYISFRDGDGWSAPRNFGAPVNRPGASGVFTPFVSADGRTLYFAERRSALEPLPERPMDAAEVEAYLRNPGNGQGDLYALPWSAEAYR
jgi:Tol biopolymer transport system component